MAHPDPDCQTVIDLTETWLQCVASQDTARVEELLTEDFIYSRHPKYGKASLDKREIIALMTSIEESETRIIGQHVNRFDDVIVVHNLTQANQKVADADETSPDPERNPSFLNKRLVDSSAWRREGAAWRCFDYRLIDALD